MNIEDLKDCMVTSDQVRQKLEEIESKLAIKLGFNGYISGLDVDGTIREYLIYKDCANYLNEDDLVTDWQQTLASHLNDLEEEFPEKLTEFTVFVNLCHYDIKYMMMSFPIKKNEFYQNILNIGEKAIPALLKYINYFHWWAYSLLNDITKTSNIQLPEFPKESAGKVYEVRDYWVKWGKSVGYIK